MRFSAFLLPALAAAAPRLAEPELSVSSRDYYADKPDPSQVQIQGVSRQHLLVAKVIGRHHPHTDMEH